MRKKWFALLAAFAVMAVILSVTAMAADGGSQMPDVGVITSLFERITLSFKAFFNILDKIYIFFRDVYC